MPQITTIQLVLGIGMFIIAVTGINLALLLRFMYTTGRFVGKIESRLEEGEKAFNGIEGKFSKIDTDLNNHMQTNFSEIRQQLKEYSKVIDSIASRLIRVEERMEAQNKFINRG